MKQTILITAAILLLGCNASKKGSELVVDIIEAAPSESVILSEKMMAGKNHYLQHCAECHKLKKPTSYTEKQWRTIVPKMAAKANKEEQVLDEKTEASILAYLIEMTNNQK